MQVNAKGKILMQICSCHCRKTISHELPISQHASIIQDTFSHKGSMFITHLAPRSSPDLVSAFYIVLILNEGSHLIFKLPAFIGRRQWVNFIDASREVQILPHSVKYSQNLPSVFCVQLGDEVKKGGISGTSLYLDCCIPEQSFHFLVDESQKM